LHLIAADDEASPNLACNSADAMGHGYNQAIYRAIGEGGGAAIWLPRGWGRLKVRP
jgi:hypothetical protein